ncbi:MAG: hypothetical protein ACFB2Z_01230 [Maricaulaceae bacterium]
MRKLNIEPVFKTLLRDEALRNQFPQLIEILHRGNEGELVLRDAEEAYRISDLLIFIRQRVLLQHPYDDDETAFYNEDHEDAAHEFEMGIWVKVLSNLKTYFGVPFPGERGEV